LLLVAENHAEVARRLRSAAEHREGAPAAAAAVATVVTLVLRREALEIKN
jgi:hypothetical protein